MLYLTHANVLTPDMRFLEDSTVAIAAGRIEAVYPAGAAPRGILVPLHLRGRWVIPALIDMDHAAASGQPAFFARPGRTLRELPQFGVLGVFHPGGAAAGFRMLKKTSAEPRAARFFGGARTLAAPISSSAEARDLVRRLVGLRVDAVTFRCGCNPGNWRGPGPALSRQVAAAIVDEAHRAGIPAFVRAPSPDCAREALRMGVDALLGGVDSGPVGDDLLLLLLRSGAAYVPSLARYELASCPSAWFSRLRALTGRPFRRLDNFLFRAALAFAPRSRSALRRRALAFSNLKAVSAAGVPVALGTGAGPAGLVSGASVWAELQLYVEAGLTPAGALRAATRNAASMLRGSRNAGVIEPGMLADLVILDANPLDDIRNVSRVYKVLRGGNIIASRRN